MKKIIKKAVKKKNYSTDVCHCKHNHSSSSCDDDNYTVETRIQFTINTSPDTICDLLSMIGNECINLDGYFVQALNDNCSLLTFVIGDENEQDCQDLRTVRCILKKLCIKFLENEVLRVIKPTTGPGTLAKLYCRLSSNDVEVNNIYPSADGDAIYVEPKCIRAAKCIL